MVRKQYREDIRFAPNLIYIGKNASGNQQIVEMSKSRNQDGNEIWFHLDGYTSCHVIIENQVEITDEMIDYCCGLVRKYSKSFDESKLPIQYAYVRDIHLTDILGFVQVDRTINVKIV